MQKGFTRCSVRALTCWRCVDGRDGPNVRDGAEEPHYLLSTDWPGIAVYISSHCILTLTASLSIYREDE